jgi:hypothetical protein
MSLDTHQSVYRERLLEHLVLGELLKHSWLHHGASLEVSQPSLDRAGHDVVLEANGIVRHVQFKSSSRSAKTSRQTVHLDLAKKPSGCVIWIRFEPTTLSLGPYLFLGGPPGKRLPSISQLPIAKHTKANAQGLKLERPNLRVVPKNWFNEIVAIPELYDALFGT